MKRVILVNPDLGFSWAGYMNKPNLPLAILHVGSAVSRAGFEVDLIDQRVEKDWESRLLAGLREEPLCVGISSMTGTQILGGLAVAEIVRRHCRAPIVWGGIHPSLMPEQTLANPLVDFVVRGEGEATMTELCGVLAGRGDPAEVHGVSYRETGRVRHNPDREHIDLDATDPLDYELLDLSRYIRTVNGRRAVNFITSRGCPHACKYCYAGRFHGRHWRALSVEHVLARLRALMDRYGVNSFWFDDDEFFVNLERTRELLEGLRKLNVTWSSRGARIDSILRMDDRFLDLVVESGCHRLASGVESGSDRILAMIGKSITREDARSAMRRLRERNLYPRVNFMMGFPTETMEDLRMTVSLALELSRDNPRLLFAPFSFFTPYPGCDLFDMAVEHGFEPPDALAKWARMRLTVFNASWVPRAMWTPIRMLAFTTPFLNESVDTRPSRGVRMLSRLYRPLARSRIRHFFFRFPLEIALAKGLNLYDR